MTDALSVWCEAHSPPDLCPVQTVQQTARARWAPYAVVAALTALALLLPTANPTLDAWYYAACVRWRHDLLLPHHLLYNPLGVVWVAALPGNPDGIAALTAGNALLYGGILLALRPVLRAAGAPENSLWAWLLMVGGTFGMLRFATENEVYLAPILVSLLASGAWGRWVAGRGDAWLVAAGVLAASGCLLLQMHFWWWLALGIGTWWGRPITRLRWRAAVLYGLPALLVPLGYALAAHHEGFPLAPKGLIDFIFHDYVVSGATPTPGVKTFIFTAINLVRTLVQVHGSTGVLLVRWPALAVVPVAAAALLWRAWRARGGGNSSSPAGAPASAAIRRIRLAHGWAFGLHAVFAAVNDGNAEFMVMLPVLGAVLAAGWGRWQPQAVAHLGAALLLWNLAFGLLPNRLLTLNASAALAARIRAEPTAHWLLTDQHLTENRLTYQTGQFRWPRLHPSPTVRVRRDGGDARPFRQWLRATLATGRPVLTDALSPARPFDRAQLALGNRDAELLRGFSAAPLDSVPTFFGPVVLTRLAE